MLTNHQHHAQDLTRSANLPEALNQAMVAVNTGLLTATIDIEAARTRWMPML